MLKVTHRENSSSGNTGRGPSPNLWGDCDWLAMVEDPGIGITEFLDFVSGGLITAPTTHAALVGLPISGYSSTGSQISYGNAAYTTANEAGTLILAETTTREGTAIRSDVVPYRISSNMGKFWFECRFKINTVAADEISFFTGLYAAATLSASVPIVAAGADTHLMADNNWVGFHKPVGDTTTFDAAYKADGVTQVTTNDGLGTLAAGTYIKLGMKFDPDNASKLSWYVNGIKAATEKTVPNNTGTDFPADVALGWVIAMSVGTAASDNTLTLDWVRAAQLFKP